MDTTTNISYIAVIMQVANFLVLYVIFRFSQLSNIYYCICDITICHISVVTIIVKGIVTIV